MEDINFDAPGRSDRCRGLQDFTVAIRRHTLALLDVFSDQEALWTPPGTSNHAIWHAGHALWVQDVLCLQIINGTGELPFGWEQQFGMGSHPGRQKNGWPARSEVRTHLEKQVPYIIATLDSLSPSDLDARPRFAHPGDPRTLWECVRHGLHDEANHQGEMYLLLKMNRSRGALGWLKR